MIKIENTKVEGWETAIRGMRNPMNSWEKSDTLFLDYAEDDCIVVCHDISGDRHRIIPEDCLDKIYDGMKIGPNDTKLMKSLVAGGPVHAKFRRFISVTMDLTAPFYWWNDFDTYRIGRCDANGATSFWGHDIEYDSCSTMHKIHAKEFTLDDFSHEHLIDEFHYTYDETEETITDEYLDTYCLLDPGTSPGDNENPYSPYYNGESTPCDILSFTINMLNRARELYLKTKDKKYWWQMIQLLPNSYNQMRTVKLNYEVLAGLYSMRKDHKQDEFKSFCKWIENLPYAKELIIVEETVTDTEEQLRARFTAYEKRIEYLEEMMCKELYKAYDMSVEDISEKTGIAVSAVKYFVSDDMGRY